MRTKLFVIAITILFPVAAVAQQVHEECPQSWSGQTGKKELASAWFNRANGLAEQSSFKEALGAYACSYRFVQHPNTLFNMGQTALKSANDPLALELFEKYIAENPNGAFAKTAKERIVEIKNRQAAAQTPTGPSAEEPGSRWRVVEDDEPEGQGDVREKEAPPEPPLAGHPVVSYEQPDKGSNFKGILGWSGIALGGAALATGIGLQIGAYNAVDSAENAKTLSEFDDNNDKASSLQNAATALFITAGVAAAGGAVLLILNRSDESDQVAWVVYPGGVGLNGRF